ncbi:LuxR C-terminal-related transcriptional regulator [Devosia sp.]|uniref:LuxR C-terminal-related transcriptional regulator n=1 Tax=Devosia sp. TaxID=1871048 RepID=UPI003A926BA0
MAPNTTTDVGEPAPQPPIRIAFIDDHPTLLMGMSALFASNPRFEIVGSGVSADDAVAVARQHKPDVLTMDLSMPGDVYAAITEVLDASMATRVIVFTAYADVDRALMAIDSGAHGFVLKGQPAEELLAAIDSVRRGSLYISPEFAPKVLSGFRHRSQREVEKSAAKLSPREKQLVDCLFEAMSNKEIARTLNLTEKTVKHYMTNLMNKLKVKSRLEVVLAASRLRLRYGPEEVTGDDA